MGTMIRRATFETNSSSAHSLTLASPDDPVNQTMYVTEDGVVEVELGEYGWEFDDYYDPDSKASYLATLWQKEFDKMKILVEAIERVTGAKRVEFKGIGYVDHQSTDTADCLVTVDDVVDFVFKSSSSFSTGNDNV